MRLPTVNVAAAVVAVINVSAAVAQEASQITVEEVLVTASKRGEQVLQEVAGNIQVISSQTLEQLNVGGLDDYVKLVPGLDMISSGAGQSQVVLRGVTAGREDEHPREATSLSTIYVDDIPLSMPGYMPDLGVFDVERIEVLRGPQGTLYGASAMSGTIRVITKEPKVDEFSGKVKLDAASVAGGDPQYGASASLNVPLTQRLALGVTTFGSHRGGVIDNVDPVVGRKDYNEQQKVGGRARLVYYGDAVTLKGTFFYDKLEADGRPDEFQPDPGDPRLDLITGERQIRRFIAKDLFNSEFMGGSLGLEMDVGELARLTSVTSYYEMDALNYLDDTYRLNLPGFIQRFTGVPLSVANAAYVLDWTTSSLINETRLASTAEGRLQWVAGVYYEDNKRRFREWETAAGLNASLGLGPNDPVLGNPPDYFFRGQREVQSEHFAVFGEAAYRIVDSLELLVGLRWFTNERHTWSKQSGYLRTPLNAHVQTQIQEDDVIPKVQLTYNINDDATVYALFSEGYRQGGTNGPAFPHCAPDLAAIGKSNGEGYTSDGLFNYELGAKTSWLDRRLIVNATAFHIIWKDIQTPVPLSCGSTPTYNAGQIENTGLETEVSFRASQGLTLRLGVSLMLESEVTKAVAGVNAVGDKPGYVHDLMASASADYRFPLGQGEAFARTDVRYVDATQSEFSSLPSALTLPSHNIVDLTLGYQRGDWDFTLSARNLLDDRVVTNIDPDRAQPATYSLGATRTLGLAIARSF